MTQEFKKLEMQLGLLSDITSSDEHIEFLCTQLSNCLSVRMNLSTSNCTTYGVVMTLCAKKITRDKRTKHPRRPRCKSHCAGRHLLTS